MNKTKYQIFIAYYFNGENKADAEIYIGKTGSNKEFIKYFEMANGMELGVDDIEGVYPIIKEMGIDGKMYKIIIKQ